jgi:ABC-type multidrug transport system ATPase subunit
VRIRNLSVTLDDSPSGPAALVAGLARRRKRGELPTSPASHVKTILDHVSADMPSGSLTAIIGGSGSGKTSMLNVMSRRMHGSRVAVTGTASFNHTHDFTSVRSAYVMQQDVLIPSLTVRETLQYSADLRLPSSVSSDERRRVVEEVILELGLKEAADTRIGNHAHKGCSGGEKRRTSIGVQVRRARRVLLLCRNLTRPCSYLRIHQCSFWTNPPRAWTRPVHSNWSER